MNTDMSLHDYNPFTVVSNNKTSGKQQTHRKNKNLKVKLWIYGVWFLFTSFRGIQRRLNVGCLCVHRGESTKANTKRRVHTRGTKSQLREQPVASADGCRPLRNRHTECLIHPWFWHHATPIKAASDTLPSSHTWPTNTWANRVICVQDDVFISPKHS